MESLYLPPNSQVIQFDIVGAQGQLYRLRLY